MKKFLVLALVIFIGLATSEISAKMPKKEVTEQPCVAIDDEQHFYQDGIGKSHDRMVAQRKALQEAQMTLLQRTQNEAMELEMVCNKFSIDESGNWVAYIVVRTSKKQNTLNDTIMEDAEKPQVSRQD